MGEFAYNLFQKRLDQKTAKSPWHSPFNVVHKHKKMYIKITWLSDDKMARMPETTFYLYKILRLWAKSQEELINMHTYNNVFWDHSFLNKYVFAKKTHWP